MIKLEVRGPSGPQLLVGGPSGRLDFVLRAPSGVQAASNTPDRVKNVANERANGQGDSRSRIEEMSSKSGILDVKRLNFRIHLFWLLKNQLTGRVFYQGDFLHFLRTRLWCVFEEEKKAQSFLLQFVQLLLLSLFDRLEVLIFAKRLVLHLLRPTETNTQRKFVFKDDNLWVTYDLSKRQI